MKKKNRKEFKGLISYIRAYLISFYILSSFIISYNLSLKSYFFAL